jgi:hypothetical protein
MIRKSSKQDGCQIDFKGESKNVMFNKEITSKKFTQHRDRLRFSSLGEKNFCLNEAHSAFDPTSVVLLSSDFEIG